MVCVVILLCAMYVVSLHARLSRGCPTWYSNRTGHCECGPTLNKGIICNEEAETVVIQVGHCMTFDYNTQSVLAAGCPYGYTSSMTNRMYALLPKDPTQLNETLCGPYNREGLLCENCVKGFGPAAYSTDLRCANCTDISTGYAIILYLVVEMVPVTFFFFVVVMFRLNITSGPMLGYVMFCQAWSFSLNLYIYLWPSALSYLPSYLRIPANVVISLADMWNLHFLRYVLPSFCLSEKMSEIHVHMLGFFTAIYLLSLMVIVYIAIELHAKKYRCVVCLGKPFKMCFVKFNKNWKASDSVIHAFATFIMLSSYTLTCDAVTLFTNSVVYDVNSKAVRSVLYYDPSVVMYSTEHICYIVIAVILCLTLSICPALLLCLYPTRAYERLSRYFSPRKRLAVKIFAEAFHSCFKDGLNGTRDYRATAGFIVMAPILFALVSYFIDQHLSSLSIGITYGIMSFFISFCLSYLRPCKSLIMNISLSFHTMLFGTLAITIGLWCEGSSFSTEVQEVTFAVLLVIPHIVILIWILVHCVNFDYGRHFKTVLTMLRRKAALLLRKRQDYQELCD